MGRQIVPSEKKRLARGGITSLDICLNATGNQGVNTENEPDDYFQRLIKYIPAESIVLYQTLNGIVATANMQGTKIHWVIFIVVFTGNIEYMRKILKIKLLSQIIISSIAFIVWAISLGQPFSSLPGWNVLYGTLLLPIFTFFAPIYVPSFTRR